MLDICDLSALSLTKSPLIIPVLNKAHCSLESTCCILGFPNFSKQKCQLEMTHLFQATCVPLAS